jgi:uncharacterized protein YegL
MEVTKMNRNLTEIVFILDRSGSMSGLESDTIGGYNAMLSKQQEENGEAIVTTVLFDDEYQLLHDRFNINWIKPITHKEYYVGGSTALLDAMGKSIQKIINVQKNTSDDQKADKVLFVITTDGMENASHEYSYSRIKKMVEYQKEKYGWEFIFLGANIDAVLTAERFGITRDRAANYHSDGEGTRLNFDAVSNVVSDLRASKAISKNWKEDIDKDFERRQKK